MYTYIYIDLYMYYCCAAAGSMWAFIWKGTPNPKPINP